MRPLIDLFLSVRKTDAEEAKQFDAVRNAYTEGHKAGYAKGLKQGRIEATGEIALKLKQAQQLREATTREVGSLRNQYFLSHPEAYRPRIVQRHIDYTLPTSSQPPAWVTAPMPPKPEPESQVSGLLVLEQLTAHRECNEETPTEANLPVVRLKLAQRYVTQRREAWREQSLVLPEQWKE